MLKSLDADQHDLNGNDGESANNDDDKVILILRKIGYDHMVPLHITRLGAPAPDKTRRPIKVIVASTQTRKNILNDTRKLKQAGDAFSKIYVKKDTHPGIRKEMGRIQASEKREKEKPENQGCEVKYDQASRTLTVDGTIVDCYNPTFVLDNRVKPNLTLLSLNVNGATSKTENSVCINLFQQYDIVCLSELKTSYPFS